MTLRIDFETRSRLPLGGKESVGLWNYAHHESTLPLMLAYAFANDEVQIWEPHLDPMPADLEAALRNPDVSLGAFNSSFERYILNFKLGFDIKAERFAKDDSQVGGRYLSLPGDLESVCQILGLPESMQKDKRGEQLIHLFSEPQKPRKKKGQPLGEEYFNDWTSHPVEWEQFKEYCKRDVIAERECARRMQLLQAMPLPEFEQKVWIFDQKVNDRGIPVDLDFVQKAYKLALKSKKEALDRQNAITGLDNANSRNQLLPWVRARGYPYSTLDKTFVDPVLANSEIKLTDECRAVLTARREASSTSYQKLSSVIRQISPDGRLRNQFIFMGSTRCGRWSSGATQIHNMARPSKEFENKENLIAARQMIYAEDYDGIKARFKSVLLTIKNCIRTMFVAPKGYKFIICDENAIETRVGSWVAECPSLLHVFDPLPGRPNGRDPYLDFAVKMTGIHYEKLEADIQSKDETVKALAKERRQVAKPGVLAAIYQQGAGGWKKGKKGYKDPETGETIYDQVKGGLWGYAEKGGYPITLEQATEVVRIFRESYREIVECWGKFERAVAEVLDPKAINVVRYLGPNGCIKIDKINITGRYPLLRMQLPSGRYLHYWSARIEPTKMPWQDAQGNDVYRDSLVYASVNQESHNWQEHTTSSGGKIFQNSIQGIARCVLAAKLMEMEAAEMPVVLHVHDEGGSLVPDDPFSPTHELAEQIMAIPMSWGPGLILGANGFENDFYMKG